MINLIGCASVRRATRTIFFVPARWHLDLRFFSRTLRRLIAVELKIGRFRAEYEG